MIRRTISAILTLLLAAAGANAYWEEHDVGGQYMFGYASVGDNPQLYMPEVEGNRIPTNVQSLSVNTPTDNLEERLTYLRSRGQRAVIVLDNLLFINVSTLNTSCGAYSWRHRLNFQARFDAWLNLNSAWITSEHVAALVVNTEVNNRCISYDSLNQVAQYVTSRVHSIPAAAGYGESEGAQPLPDAIPASLHGVLFFKYVVFDPRADAAYQQAFLNLKSKLTPAQRIILVPDGFYGPAHRAADWPKWYLGHLALNYTELAKNDPSVVGLIFFLWPGFSDGSGTFNLGVRELPQNVRDRHRLAACSLKIQSPLLGTCD